MSISTKPLEPFSVNAFNFTKISLAIQFGDNGDFGISVTIQHSRSQSFSAYLSQTKVNPDQEVRTGDLKGKIKVESKAKATVYQSIF